MGFTARHLPAAAVAGAALAALATPARAAGPNVTWVGTNASVYTHAERPPSSIRRVVIHTTEGSFWGAVKWLQSGRVKASAHYVVSQQGEIVQLVRDSDIAWHAGNYLVNRDSIGIEHAGFANVRGSITEAEYRASARLSAWIARRSLMPIDRSHFIGHVDVPDPNNARLHGGFSHHHDPGPYWEWNRYLSYVRSFARGAQPPKYVGATPAAPKPTVPKQPIRAGEPPSRQTGLSLRVTGTTLRTNAVVSGFVRWAVAVGGKVSRVDFLVDGRVRWTEKSAPFVFGGDSGRWDTTREANGSHVLTLRVVGAAGKVAGSSTKVRVVNMPFQVVSKGLANGEIVSSTVHWEATGAGGAPDRVEFLVDGRIAHSDEDAPFGFDWETKKVANGPHSLTLRGVAEDGRVATTTLGIVVANETAEPPKQDDFGLVSQSLRDSQTVSGAVKWQVDVRGKVDRVEFSIDGVLRWTDKTAPYVFNGDEGRLDAALETPGAHTLAVRVYARDGRSVAAAITVFVSSGAPRDGGGGRGTTSLRVSSSLRGGERVSGPVRWEAQTDGGNVKRVEFWIDGKLRHTETSAPYTFGGDDAKWDTVRETNGDHKLVVRVIGTDGTVSESVETISVFNEPPPIGVAIAGVADGATVKGRLHVDANVKGPIERVEFIVTRTVRRTDTSAPFDFDWDTARDTEGPHAITVRAVTRDGRETTATLEVTVANTQPLTVSLPSFSASVKGTVHVEAKVGGTAERVEFSVDGRLRQTERSAPYEFDWNTKDDADGAHVLSVRAFSGARTADAQAQVKVANAAVVTAPPPPPPPPPLPQALAVTLPTLTVPVEATVHLEAKVAGTAERVEFLVDGKLRHTETSAPYEFDWDTKTEADGTHRLTARAVAGTKTAEAFADLVVRNAADAPKPAVTLSGLSATAKGTVHVVAKVDNAIPERVEFLVDGTVRHTELTAPYEFDWDTKADKDGQHTLTARAVIGTARPEAQLTVTVANAVTPPPPPPPPPAPADFTVSATGLADGQTVTGTVSFTAAVGGDARRVELWIDGQRRATARTSPFAFSWNVRREGAGRHEVVLRAYARDGRVATATLSVTVG